MTPTPLPHAFQTVIPTTELDVRKDSFVARTTAPSFINWITKPASLRVQIAANILLWCIPSAKDIGAVAQTDSVARCAGPENVAKMARCGKAPLVNFVNLAKNAKRQLILLPEAATSAPSTSVGSFVLYK